MGGRGGGGGGGGLSKKRGKAQLVNYKSTRSLSVILLVCFISAF